MVKQKRSRPIWWQLDALALMTVGLLFLAHRFAPSPGWRTFLEVGVVVVGYGLIILWLETHPNVLLRRPAAEADSPAVQSPQVEIISSPLSSQLRCHFYVGSDPVIIYDISEQPTSHLRLNGHHPVITIPSLPEEVA
jgi:hypothetical protein